MEEEVLERYQQICEHTLPEEMSCVEHLRYKYNIIRYNLCFQTKHYSQCVGLFRQLCAFEHADFNFEQQRFLFLITGFLNRKPSARSLKRLRDADIVSIIKQASADPGCSSSLAAQGKAVLKICSGCAMEEGARGDFKTCSKCRKVWYCSAECQKSHWKCHKRECAGQ